LFSHQIVYTNYTWNIWKIFFYLETVFQLGQYAFKMLPANFNTLLGLPQSVF